MSGGTSPLTPRPTAAYAPIPTARASTSKNSSAPRRRRWTNCMRAPGCALRWGISARRLPVGREALHGALGVDDVAGPDALLHRPRAVGVEVADLDVGGLVGVGEVDPGDVGLDAAEDRDHAVLLT